MMPPSHSQPACMHGHPVSATLIALTRAADSSDDVCMTIGIALSGPQSNYQSDTEWFVISLMSASSRVLLALQVKLAGLAGYLRTDDDLQHHALITGSF
jgi:hypothetical protein